MAVITRAMFIEYLNGIDQLSEAAARYVTKALRVYFAENPDWTVAGARDFAIATLIESDVYAEAASTLAAAFYDGIMANAGVDDEVDGAEVDTTIPFDEMERRVRYKAAHLVRGDVDGFIKQVGDASWDLTRKRADDTMVANARRLRDRGVVKFARVPTGRETCTFCMQLAGHGFFYNSRETAEQCTAKHNHCDCVVVSSIDAGDGSVVDGYDSDVAAQLAHDFEELDHDRSLTWAERRAEKDRLMEVRPLWS